MYLSDGPERGWSGFQDRIPWKPEERPLPLPPLFDESPSPRAEEWLREVRESAALKAESEAGCGLDICQQWGCASQAEKSLASPSSSAETHALAASAAEESLFFSNGAVSSPPRERLHGHWLCTSL